MRYLEPTSLISDQPDGRVGLVVADLSFISILTVVPALVRCTTEDAHLIVLVKPQFEAGRSAVGRGGIVRDPSIHREVMLRVCAGLAQGQLPVVAATVSPLTGADGNREFLVHIDRAGARNHSPRNRVSGVSISGDKPRPGSYRSSRFVYRSKVEFGIETGYHCIGDHSPGFFWLEHIDASIN